MCNPVPALRGWWGRGVDVGTSSGTPGRAFPRTPLPCADDLLSAAGGSVRGRFRGLRSCGMSRCAPPGEVWDTRCAANRWGIQRLVSSAALPSRGHLFPMRTMRCPRRAVRSAGSSAPAWVGGFGRQAAAHHSRGRLFPMRTMCCPRRAVRSAGGAERCTRGGGGPFGPAGDRDLPAVRSHWLKTTATSEPRSTPDVASSRH